MRRRVRHEIVFVLVGWAVVAGAGVTADEGAPQDSQPIVGEEPDGQPGDRSDSGPSQLSVSRTIPAENLRIPDELQPCATHLKKLHAAIKRYEQDTGKLSDWLSDLVPKHVDAKDLLCPVHGRTKAGYWPDPKLPCSYTYEFSATKLSDDWEAVSGMVCQDWKLQQVKLFGDVVPLIRCFHPPQVVSLTMGGQVFSGMEVWERVFKPDYRRGDELPPSERPFSYLVPPGGVNELAQFIADVKALDPQTRFQTLDHERRAPGALKAAATRILQMEDDVWASAYQIALRVLLEDRIRMLPNESPASWRDTVLLVKQFLAGKRERRLERDDVAVAQLLARRLEEIGHPQLAAEAYQEFARILAEETDTEILDAAKRMDSAAKRLRP